MKTIAITIDEEALAALDRLAGTVGRGRARRKRGNRSALVRAAVREFIERRTKAEAEREEWGVWARKIDRINRQAEVLIGEQAQL